jgi:hypothetical protein
MQGRTGETKGCHGALRRSALVAALVAACGFALTLGIPEMAAAQGFRSFGGDQGGGGMGGDRGGFGPRGGYGGGGGFGMQGGSGDDGGFGFGRGGGFGRRGGLSWRRPASACTYRNCGWGRGDGYPPRPVRHPRRPPVFYPPIDTPPPFYESSGDDPGPVYRRPPRHPRRPVYSPPPAPVRRIVKKRPVTPAPVIAVKKPVTPARLAKKPPVNPPPVMVSKQPTDPSHFIVPPATETRYVQNEVLVEIPTRLTAGALRGIEQRLGLTLIASEDFALLSAKVNRYRIAPPRSVSDVVRTLRAEGRVGGAQPNYVFALQQSSPPVAGAAPGAAPLPPMAGFDDPSPQPPLTGAQPTEPQPVEKAASVSGPAPAATPVAVGPPVQPASPTPATPTSPAAIGDATPSPQYTIAALHLVEAHRLATGKGIRIAIIDSGIDGDSVEIKDRIVARFDAIGGAFQPHSHGTAIAGVILAHVKLVGVAPDSQVIAIRAFTGEGKTNGAEGTSFQILQGLKFAAAQKARIVNMSFAGPHDAMFARALSELRVEGVAEVAAAGNGGAKSAPLYPGAEPGVIAVTATDSRGQLFGLANRGAYIAIAAPGVDILLPALGDTVQIASGTSIAAAHVTGIAALALERYGSLAPDALISTLDAGARRPDPAASADEYGAGVIDAFGVIQSKAGAGAPQPAPVASAVPR